MEHEQPSGHWTNEKHCHYLDAMESSFVRTMLEERSAGRSTRLDRYIPDSSDSTRDSPSRTWNKHHNSSSSSSSGKGKKDARDDNKRWRRHPTTDDNSVLDQVVPQMSYKGDKGGKD
ncbi:hypothetical protein MLD38_019837 [Melastoma candidum]|uniref:Uncharacterized protein n=1 Tax=Melastoma candidum TaxID=119954 RepID=A0ACB9QAQ0_9MYRT|nr:hypothetical protein MLD38_019837 [Melastoma candidum]